MPCLNCSMAWRQIIIRPYLILFWQDERSPCNLRRTYRFGPVGPQDFARVHPYEVRAHRRSRTHHTWSGRARGSRAPGPRLSLSTVSGNCCPLSRCVESGNPQCSSWAGTPACWAQHCSSVSWTRTRTYEKGCNNNYSKAAFQFIC